MRSSDERVTTSDGNRPRFLRRPGKRGVVCLALLWLAIVGLAVPQVARAAGAESGPWSYVVAVVPWVTFTTLVAALGAILGVALVRTVHVAAPALVLIVLSALGISTIAPLYIAEPSAGEDTLVVATFNMSFGHADAAQMTQIVREHDVHIVAIEELTFDGYAALVEAGFEDAMPHGVAFPEDGAGGTAVYSRFPLDGERVLNGYTFNNVSTVVHAPGGDVTFYAVHSAPPLPTHTDDWERDMRLLGRQIAQVEGPIIVAGDFNSTYDHAVFRDILAQGFHDAAHQAGAGLLLTYPDGANSQPLVAIDHVLERDSGLTASEAYTIGVDGTDHRALVVRYAADVSR